MPVDLLFSCLLAPLFTSANTIQMVCLSFCKQPQVTQILTMGVYCTCALLTLLLPPVYAVASCLLYPGHNKQCLLQYAVFPYFTDKIVVVLAE